MKGVSVGVIEIQREFLDFEKKYKSTQNIFDEVYKLTKIAKSSRMDDINDRTYKLSEMFVGMSEKYLSTKIKVMEMENDYSLLDDYVKQVVLTMMEQNKTMLMDIELNLKVLLSLLVERKIVPKQKINKIIEKEEKSNGSVIFVSKYETVNSYDNIEYIYSMFLRSNLRKFVIIIFMAGILIFAPNIVDLITNVLGSITSTLGETTSPDTLDTLSMTASFSSDLVEAMRKLVSVITTIFLFLLLNIFMFQLMADLLYISVPLLRPYLSKMVSNNLGIDVDNLSVPVQIEKFKLVRAKEILESIRGMKEYCNAPVVIYLNSKLKNKTVDEVLSMDDTYAILLVEELYQVINNYHNSNKEFVEYSLGLRETADKKHMLLKVMMLKERLGLN